MPRLPSGRLIALGNAPYRELVGRAVDTKDAGLVLFYDKDAEFHTLLEVLLVEWRADIPAAELDPVETGKGERHGILSSSGFTVQDILRGRAPWSRSDIVAFRKFLGTPRISEWTRGLRKDLVWLRGWLTDGAIFQPDPHAMLPRACFRQPELSASQE